MRPKYWDEEKEIKYRAKLYELLEKLAEKQEKNTDTLTKYILLDGLAPPFIETGRRLEQLAAEVEELLKKAISESEDKSRDEPPELLN